MNLMEEYTNIESSSQNLETPAIELKPTNPQTKLFVQRLFQSSHLSKKTIEKTRDYLCKLPYFSQLSTKLSKQDFDTMIRNVNYEFIPAGNIVFQKGQSSQKAYVILDGAVKVLLKTQLGDFKSKMRSYSLFNAIFGEQENQPQSSIQPFQSISKTIPGVGSNIFANRARNSNSRNQAGSPPLSSSSGSANNVKQFPRQQRNQLMISATGKFLEWNKSNQNEFFDEIKENKSIGQFNSARDLKISQSKLENLGTPKLEKQKIPLISQIHMPQPQNGKLFNKETQIQAQNKEQIKKEQIQQLGSQTYVPSSFQPKTQQNFSSYQLGENNNMNNNSIQIKDLSFNDQFYQVPVINGFQNEQSFLDEDYNEQDPDDNDLDDEDYFGSIDAHFEDILSFLDIDTEQVFHFKQGLDIHENYKRQFSCFSLIRTLSNGESFGEIKSWKNCVRSNTMVTAQDTHLLYFDKDYYMRNLNKIDMEIMEDKFKFIKSYPFTEQIQKKISTIIYCFEEKQFFGRSVYLEGDQVEQMYLIKEGNIELKQLYTRNQICTQFQDRGFTYENPDLLPSNVQFDNQQMGFTCEKQSLLQGGSDYLNKQLNKTIANLGPGGYFGEEEILLNQTQRFYSAEITSANLVLYSISIKNLRLICRYNDIMEKLKDNMAEQISWRKDFLYEESLIDYLKTQKLNNSLDDSLYQGRSVTASINQIVKNQNSPLRGQSCTLELTGINLNQFSRAITTRNETYREINSSSREKRSDFNFKFDNSLNKQNSNFSIRESKASGFINEASQNSYIKALKQQPSLNSLNLMQEIGFNTQRNQESQQNDQKSRIKLWLSQQIDKFMLFNQSSPDLKINKRNITQKYDPNQHNLIESSGQFRLHSSISKHVEEKVRSPDQQQNQNTEEFIKKLVFSPNSLENKQKTIQFLENTENNNNNELKLNEDENGNCIFVNTEQMMKEKKYKEQKIREKDKIPGIFTTSAYKCMITETNQIDTSQISPKRPITASQMTENINVIDLSAARRMKNTNEISSKQNKENQNSKQNTAFATKNLNGISKSVQTQKPNIQTDPQSFRDNKVQGTLSSTVGPQLTSLTIDLDKKRSLTLSTQNAPGIPVQAWSQKIKNFSDRQTIRNQLIEFQQNRVSKLFSLKSKNEIHDIKNQIIQQIMLNKNKGSTNAVVDEEKLRDLRRLEEDSRLDQLRKTNQELFQQDLIIGMNESIKNQFDWSQIQRTMLNVSKNQANLTQSRRAIAYEKYSFNKFIQITNFFPQNKDYNMELYEESTECDSQSELLDGKRVLKNQNFKQKTSSTQKKEQHSVTKSTNQTTYEDFFRSQLDTNNNYQAISSHDYQEDTSVLNQFTSSQDQLEINFINPRVSQFLQNMHEQPVIDDNVRIKVKGLYDQIHRTGFQSASSSSRRARISPLIENIYESNMKNIYLNTANSSRTPSTHKSQNEFTIFSTPQNCKKLLIK